MENNIKIGFSLDMINVHHQEPNRNRYESKYYWDELYPMISAAGFNAVEIPFDPFWIFRGGSGVPFTKYCVDIKFETVANFVNHLKSNGIEKVAGIHFNPTIFMRNENLDFYFGASGYFGGESIKYAAELGCDYINITPTPPFGLIEYYHGKSNNWESDFMKRTIELINNFAKIAKENSIKMVLRNEYWSVIRNQNFDDFLSQIDNSVTFDLDAANLDISTQNPSEMVNKFANRIGSVHLTDTAFVDDAEIWKTALPEFPQHRATQVFRDLGFGNTNLREFYQTLQTVSYDGWAIASCRQTREPMRALLRSKKVISDLGFRNKA